MQRFRCRKLPDMHEYVVYDDSPFLERAEVIVLLVMLLLGLVIGVRSTL